MRRRQLPPVLKERDFSLYWRAILATGFAGQMLAVAVGWQVYSINESALDLGLIGLAQFLPLPLLALPAGHIADRLPRRLVYGAAIAIDFVIALCLLVVTLAGASSLWPFLVLALAAGCASALGWPAARSLPPTLVPAGPARQRARTSRNRVSGATIAGPAIGGLLFAAQGGEVVYAVAAMLFVAALVNVLRVTEQTEERLPEAMTREALFAGTRFVRRTPVLFGAISLDLFAVLFGGAVALLPLFAKSILDVGPVGLGILRSAPAVGALVAAIILANRPIRGNAGRTLFIVVAIFGASHIVFGLSKSFPLSCAALAVAGFADMFSMNIRSMTVALATPDELRGRVNAVEMVFISGSNELERSSRASLPR